MPRGSGSLFPSTEPASALAFVAPARVAPAALFPLARISRAASRQASPVTQTAILPPILSIRKGFLFFFFFPQLGGKGKTQKHNCL